MALCSRNGGSIYPGRVALFLRTDGSTEPGIFNKGEITSELKEFLQLVAGNVDPACYPEGSFADRVQRQVHIARRNARWRKEYMDWEMTLRNEREKGREEGRMEERVKTEEQRKRAEAAEERIRRLEEQIALLEKGVH